MDSLILYKIPIAKGNKRTSNTRIPSKNPNINESIKDIYTENLRTGSNFLVIFALSGLLIMSSFISVILFNPYMLNVVKKAKTAVFKINILYNNPEKITLAELLIAKKSDVDVKNNASLLNFGNICNINLKGILSILKIICVKILWIIFLCFFSIIFK